LITPDEIESRVVLAIDTIRRKVNSGRGYGATKRVGTHTVALFGEEDYPGLEQAFEDAVKVATKIWGTPSKVGVGPGSIHADVAGLPDWLLLDSRALRYAIWSDRDVLATLAMVPHDADTLRSFEICMAVTGS